MWLRVYRSKNIGPISFYSIYKRYKSPQDALNFLATKKVEVPSEQSIDDEVEKTYRFGAKIISFQDDEYPERLRQCPDAPVFLIAKGNLSLLKRKCIAIVGSRNSSLHGNKIAADLAKGLESSGCTIVSGMARGIDRQAHIGGMKSTIAVMANGIDQIYPSENKDIYNSIIEQGLVVTESRIGTPPATHLFPGRNRIVAGLSIGTVVVEGTKYSGSLITANCALEYNRDVYCVPGSPLDPRSYGPNKLIQNGAYLIQSYEDILKQTNMIAQNPVETYETPPISDTNPMNLADEILGILSTVPTDIDELYSNLSCSMSSLKQALVEMELEGHIKHCAGNKVVRTTV